MQHAVQNREIVVRWNDVDVVRLDGHEVRDLPHGERRDVLEQSDQKPFVFSIEVLHHDEGDAAGGGDALKEFFEGF